LDKDFLLKELKMGYFLHNQKDGRAEQVINQVTNQKNRRGGKETKIKEKMADQSTTQSEKENADVTIEMLKEVVGILREQLKAKDEQLADKHNENQELIRGNRETVATVNLLSKKLFLSDGNKESGQDSAGLLVTDEEEPREPKKKRGILRFFK